MTKQLVVIGTAVMSTLLALVALWQFRIVLIYVLISLVLAATFRPIPRGESRHDVSEQLIQILKYVLGLGVAGILIFLIGRFLVSDFQQLTQALSEQTAWLLPEWLKGSPIEQLFTRWLPPPDQMMEQVLNQPAIVLSAILGITEGLGGLIGGAAVIIILSIYWSINQNHFERLWLSLLPSEERKQARFIWRTIEYDLGAYTRSEILQSLLAAVLLGVGYWLLGSPYPGLLAVTGAIACLIPVIGGVLALIPPLFLGMLDGVQLSLFSVLYTAAVIIALHIWVEPRLYKPRADNPFLTFIILLAMADAFGLLGIIAALPLAIICQILWRLLVTDRLNEDTKVLVSDLKERQAQLQAAIEEMEGPPPPLVVSSMERLSALLEKAEPVLRTAQTQKMPGPPGNAKASRG